MILKIDNYYIDFDKIDYFSCFVYLNGCYNLYLFLHLKHNEKICLQFEIKNEEIGQYLKETNGFVLMKNLFKYLKEIQNDEEIVDLKFTIKYLIRKLRIGNDKITS